MSIDRKNVRSILVNGPKFTTFVKVGGANDRFMGESSTVALTQNQYLNQHEKQIV
jgi:hypothetical protein